MLSKYRSIVVLTGAGVSAESGLKTFRDNDGLWENHRVEDVCTPEAFENNPEVVHRFYNERRAQLLTQANPNRAHIALAQFEQRFSGQFTLVTQNVDNLHEQSGSQNVLHMHGELLKVRCTRCQQAVVWRKSTNQNSVCVFCQNAGSVRPDIVWFGEVPMLMDQIEAALRHCDLFIAVGTSGNVYPAAGFVNFAAAYGAHTVELNLEPSAGQSHFAEHHYGLASDTLEQYFAQFV